MSFRDTALFRCFQTSMTALQEMPAKGADAKLKEQASGHVHAHGAYMTSAFLHGSYVHLCTRAPACTYVVVHARHQSMHACTSNITAHSSDLPPGPSACPHSPLPHASPLIPLSLPFPSLALTSTVPPSPQGLQLALQCLSFDFVGTCMDDSSEELWTIQVPSSWRAVLEDPATPKLFLDYYAATQPPLSNAALECLVRLASVRRSLFASEPDRFKFLNRLVGGTRDILRTKQGLQVGAGQMSYRALHRMNA